MASIVDSWWARKSVRKNPSVAGPFYDDRMDDGTLIVETDSIRAYSPSAVRRATRILVSRFRIPIPVAMALTQTIAPAVGSGTSSGQLYVSITSMWSPRRANRRDLTIQLFSPSGSKIPEALANELRDVGFRGPEIIGWGRSKMIWSMEEDRRD